MFNIESSFEVKVYKELIAVDKRLGATISKKDEKYYLNKHEIDVLERKAISRSLRASRWKN